MVVDTHVGRIALRLGLTRSDDPEKVEQDLMALVPRPEWTRLSHALIFHGRRICGARKPRCDECPVEKDCPRLQV
jgi:endonuclease-3